MKALDTDGIIVLYGLLGGVKGFGLKFGLNFACKVLKVNQNKSRWPNPGNAVS